MSNFLIPNKQLLIKKLKENSLRKLKLKEMKMIISGKLR
jgi:hypothetical protein